MIKQRGGFLVGLLVGLMIGLALALGVALYVAKVPVPFMNKVPQRSAAEDAAEAKRNKTWDPNAPLINRGGRPNTTSASGQVTTEIEYPAGGTDPVTAAKAPQAASGAASAAPAATTATTAVTDDGMVHYVQVGAYARVEDAETQKARLSLIGFDTKVSEREQAGRKVYRVRIGPFDTKNQAEATKASLDGVGVEASLVRVQK